MIWGHNKNLRYVPPSVREEYSRVFSGSTKIFGVLLFFSIVLSRNFSGSLGSVIKYGEYMWLIFLLLFVFYLIKVSGKINNYLHRKNTDIKTEYNRYGDSQLFNFATRTGTLRLFDSKKLILMFMIIPFSFAGLLFGLLSFHLVFFKGLSQFLPLGSIAILASSGAAFLFLFEDKRILNEAKRRNRFIDVAEKRWGLSKRIYLLLILLSLLGSSILIINDANFLTKGVLESNGRIIYDGSNKGMH